MSAKACDRCGGPTPTRDNIRGTSFWGLIQHKTTVTTKRSIRFRATYLRDHEKVGSPLIRVDEERPICDDCWGLLIGRFLQGRSVPALPGKADR
ncbi:hypothetical protein [Oerskovia paurometabola]|uniref:hypothetical protein n=1 Tax=Oerskovia paurometabola TaxID=162170 RepID=UPI00343D5C18